MTQKKNYNIIIPILYACDIIHSYQITILQGKKMTANQENKLIKVLEWTLSLHVADELFNLIIEENTTVEELQNRLDAIYKSKS